MSGKAIGTVKITGEVLEFKAATPEQVIDSYRIVNDTIKALEDIKKQLQERGQVFVEEHGRVEHDGYMLRVSSVQRTNYDKTVLRQVFDEDTLDLFLEPVKGSVDRYIKEHLEELGDQSTRLRESMIPVGKAYQVVKLEKLTRAKELES